MCPLKIVCTRDDIRERILIMTGLRFPCWSLPSYTAEGYYPTFNLFLSLCPPLSYLLTAAGVRDTIHAHPRTHTSTRIYLFTLPFLYNIICADDSSTWRITCTPYTTFFPILSSYSVPKTTSLRGYFYYQNSTRFSQLT